MGLPFAAIALRAEAGAWTPSDKPLAKEGTTLWPGKIRRRISFAKYLAAAHLPAKFNPGRANAWIGAV